jgi:AcrR family transcriptional regulator
MSSDSQEKSQDFSVSGPLSRSKILSAALRIADSGGVEALSMRNLAEALSVKAMSLYNHIANKDEILDGMVDMVVAEIEVPRSGRNWKSEMRRRALSAHEVLLRHPWAAMELMSRVNGGPAMFEYVDATLGCLLEAGFSPETADHAWNALDSHIYGFTLQELNFPFAEEDYQEAAGDYMDRIPVEAFPNLNKMATLVMSGEYDGLHDFEFGLNFILDGLEATLLKERG